MAAFSERRIGDCKIGAIQGRKCRCASARVTVVRSRAKREALFALLGEGEKSQKGWAAAGERSRNVRMLCRSARRQRQARAPGEASGRTRRRDARRITQDRKSAMGSLAPAGSEARPGAGRRPVP